MSIGARWICIILILLAATSYSLPRSVSAQNGEIIWSEPTNLSNTPDNSSTDPFIFADPAGVVHLFWAEKMSPIFGTTADTILYSQWNGRSWSRPVDLFFAPPSDGNLVVSYPHAILDDQGIIHLIWISQPNFPFYTLNYSSAPANQAQFVQAWQPRTALAENLTGTEYSIHLVYQPPSTLHIAYATGIQGENVTSEPGVTYLRSLDGGSSWSDPIEIFNTPNLMVGASNVRLLYEAPNTIYASWTVWNEDGNGDTVYFTRSLDGGVNWDKPITLAEVREGEYERDWNSMTVLPDGRLMSVWEGGFRAYRNAMFSEDDGATWTEPWDMFPTLIGENGFAEFATDSLGRLHMFLAQRIREGVVVNTEFDGTIEGLWHSVALGENEWSDPILSGGVNPMVNPKIAILQGNIVVAVWYSNLEREIIVMIGKIEDAPTIAVQPWPDTERVFRSTPESPPGGGQEPQETAPPSMPEPTISLSADETSSTKIDATNPANLVFIGAAPVLLIIPVFIFVWRRKRSSRGS